MGKKDFSQLPIGTVVKTTNCVYCAIRNQEFKIVSYNRLTDEYLLAIPPNSGGWKLSKKDKEIWEKTIMFLIKLLMSINIYILLMGLLLLLQK